MYDRPELGKEVTVVTDWSDIVATSIPTVRIVYGKRTHIGIVLQNLEFNDPASFNITTGNPDFPVANIPLHRVISLEYTSGATAVTVEAIDDESETWTVPGSKDGEYVVTRRGNRWACECKAWGFRSQCRHVNLCKEEVLSRSK